MLVYFIDLVHVGPLEKKEKQNGGLIERGVFQLYKQIPTQDRSTCALKPTNLEHSVTHGYTRLTMHSS